MRLLEQELKNVGLSDKESRVYLAGIELGPSPVQAISRKSGVNRATTYVMIESLKDRGLMSSVTKGKKRLFLAESPENILSFLKKEKETIEEKQRGFEVILEDLKKLSTYSDDQPKVSFFEGMNGIENLRTAVIESNAKIVEEFSPMDEVYKYFPPSESDHRRRFRKRCRIKLIYTSSKGAFLPKKEQNVERRFVPSEQFPFQGDIAIYGGKVNIIYYDPRVIGVLIEHKGISNTFHNLFSLAWRGAQ